MALVRSTAGSMVAREAVVLDLGDLQRHAQRIQDGAREEAARIVAEARAERERLLVGASDEGYKAGFERGLAEGRAEGTKTGHAQAFAERAALLKPLAEGFALAVHQFQADRDTMLAEAQRDVIRLAASLTQRVVKRAVELDPSLVQGQIAEVLALVMRATRVQLTINPADRPLVMECLPALAQRLVGARDVQLVDDVSVERGFCAARLMESGARVDASMRVQLERITQALLPDDRAREGHAA
jgi:flagellar biosynthesis/type III secretory pathway protein FliH